MSSADGADRAALRAVGSTVLGRRVGVVATAIAAWQPLLWVALALVAAAVVPLRYALGQNSDGLIQTLTSLQHLTPFFWEQDRFANLLPALTAWIADPIVNADAQLVLRIGFGLLAPLLFCLPASAAGDTVAPWRATLLASALILGFVPQRLIHELFVEASPYGTSFALAGLSLLALRRAMAAVGTQALAWRALGLALACAAYMVNASLVLVTVPLFALQVALLGSALATEFAVASTIAGVVTLAAVGVATDGTMPASARFGETTVGLVHYALTLTQKPGLFLGAMAALFAIAAGSRRRRVFVGHGVLLLVTFAVAFVAISLSSWVVLNSLHPRYLVPLYVLMASLGSMSLLELASRLRPATGSLAVLGLCAIALTVAAKRTKELARDRLSIVAVESRPLAEAVADVVQTRGLDGVAGDYWTVWPSVFLAEQRAYEAGRPVGGVFGLAYRGRARRDDVLARLHVQGHLTIGCLDLASPAACAALSGDAVGTRFAASSVEAPVALGGGHSLTVLRLVATGSE